MRTRIPLALAALSAAVLGTAVPAAAAPPASPPPAGALLQQFARNQLQNCAAICPYAAQGVLTVPAGLVAAPGATLVAVGAGRTPLAALGAGAASVTVPANAAMTGIIGNDLNQVVPRFQNGVLVGTIDLMRIGGGTGTVGALRTDLLAALQESLPPVAPTPPPLTTPPPFGSAPAPQGPVETSVVGAANAFFAAAFYVPELSLLGATQTANAAATTLAGTGDPVAAAAAGADAAGAIATEGASILADALSRSGGAQRTADSDSSSVPATEPTTNATERTADEPGTDTGTTQETTAGDGAGVTTGDGD
ncbi:hypothetical protein [Tsukamurella pseudospumae]|uniref:Secreted protein n=1 Tax=Tsukamurella pseudospumae TaxID=239498 RepID=A0A137ZKS7_9ACTN|nr:hypothetical protein [Tsukamurella pseudospumae]KXO98763.1 hypothetical protein AXK61_04120 [Tsukamurella pseudospumae]